MTLYLISNLVDKSCTSNFAMHLVLFSYFLLYIARSYYNLVLFCGLLAGIHSISGLYLIMQEHVYIMQN